MNAEALMHLDGCHFFVWVRRDPSGDVVLSYHERVGTDLRYHARFGGEDGRCEDCIALRDGRAPLSVSRRVDRWPDEAKASFLRVLEVVAEIEQIRAGEGSRPSSPVAPDGPVSSVEQAQERGCPPASVRIREG